ncbi:hypothetical protein [Enterovirga aerilata]|uniref:Uncharacterized protein n=1 Tax=Enterovirga aerilata TaxID=2730920 RepID=A0A849IDB1_9HYPH|nr:hypothetical protein [Enterovirga sp. DB1703]NNM74030.1 hypothetical protein [Enterovirga sp. DB1703]
MALVLTSAATEYEAPTQERTVSGSATGGPSPDQAVIPALTAPGNGCRFWFAADNACEFGFNRPRRAWEFARTERRHGELQEQSGVPKQ